MEPTFDTLSEHRLYDGFDKHVQWGRDRGFYGALPTPAGEPFAMVIMAKEKLVAAGVTTHPGYEEASGEYPMYLPQLMAIYPHLSKKFFDASVAKLEELDGGPVFMTAVLGAQILHTTKTAVLFYYRDTVQMEVTGSSFVELPSSNVM